MRPAYRVECRDCGYSDEFFIKAQANGAKGSHMHWVGCTRVDVIELDP